MGVKVFILLPETPLLNQSFISSPPFLSLHSFGVRWNTNSVSLVSSCLDETRSRYVPFLHSPGDFSQGNRLLTRVEKTSQFQIAFLRLPPLAIDIMSFRSPTVFPANFCSITLDFSAAKSLSKFASPAPAKSIASHQSLFYCVQKYVSSELGQ